MAAKTSTSFYNDSQQVKFLLNQKNVSKRSHSLCIKPVPKDPLLQTNSYWVEKSVQLPSFMNTSSAKYNIVNHTPNHAFFVKNVAKITGVCNRKKAIAEFCDFSKASSSSVNATHRVW